MYYLSRQILVCFYKYIYYLFIPIVYLNTFVDFVFMLLIIKSFIGVCVLWQAELA